MSFFSQDDFKNADHQVTGRFDKYGQFQGTVWIYGDPVSGHPINWRSTGRPTECGPFKIKFAAIEGETKASTLPWEDHARILQKTEMIGGLYIYRDGIRILPYGDTDYDWLDIELRRTRGAAYYYFSHRKMFGVVEIDSKNNVRLNEKAGREGFQENTAYRQLRSILRAFFEQMAADFFRKDGVHSDRFTSRKLELKEEDKHRKKRATQVYAKRTAFAKGLATFFAQTERDQPSEEAEQLSLDVEAELAEARRNPDPKQAVQTIVNIEREAREELRRIQSQYRIVKPRIGLTKALQKEWRDYSAAYEGMAETLFRSTRDLIDSLVAEELDAIGVDVGPQLRVEAALSDLAGLARRETKGGRRVLAEEIDRVSTDVRKLANRCLADVEESVRSALADFNRRDLSGLDDDDVVAQRESLGGPHPESFGGTHRRCWNRCARNWLRLILPASHPCSISLQRWNRATLHCGKRQQPISNSPNSGWRSKSSITSSGRRCGLYETGLRGLKAWADVNEGLQSLYHDIRASFDHLDGYLTLFTPLHRRLYRKAVDIRGTEIHKFLGDLFRERMTRHDVELVQTAGFENATIRGYPSSFYPVFVNLMDNAIYWLSLQNEKMVRRIELDFEGGVFRVSDTGPGIQRRDRDDIFEYGFTRKPGGRGMGLHISRQALRSVGYDLTLADGMAAGAMFLIGTRTAQGETHDADQ